MTHTCTHVHRHAHVLQAYQHTSAALCPIVIIIMIPIPIPFARLPAIFCLSVSQSLSQCYQMKFASKCGTWQRCDSHAHTRTHIRTASSVYIDSALMLRNANARVSISNKAEGKTPCIRTIAATAAIKVSSVYCQTICMLQTMRGEGGGAVCCLRRGSAL